jgi:uncharacterized protein YifN (PemK superfamily)
MCDFEPPTQGHPSKNVKVELDLELVLVVGKFWKNGRELILVPLFTTQDTAWRIFVNSSLPRCM